MKRVALVSAHFPPSNLVGVHRARLWARHLPEFGWKPTVVTSHWDHYQEPLDWRLLALVPEDTCVVHTKALGRRFARLVGNMALRSMWWTRRALADLAERDAIDFVHIIVPDHYSSLLGPLLHGSHGLPYGIDYMDPWIHARPRDKRLLSKAWISCVLSRYLEPWSIRSARLITGVSSATIDGVLERNPALEGVVTAEIPMAASGEDYRVLGRDYRPETMLFDPDDGKRHIVYVGTIPRSFDGSLRCFLLGLRAALDARAFDDEVRVWLIGTGTASHGAGRFRVQRAIESTGLARIVTEHPSRIAYTDALWHLRAASLVVVLGSEEAHYTPSKVYQAVHSCTPVLAFLPDGGGAGATVRACGRGMVVRYPDEPSVVIGAVARAVSAVSVIGPAPRDPARMEVDDTGPDVARTSARRLAGALDHAVSRGARLPDGARAHPPGMEP